MYLILSLFGICAVMAYMIETSSSEKQKNTMTIACLVMLTLISGTRLVGGSDFLIYEGYYDDLQTFPNVFNPEMRNKNYEIGYTYIASFFKTIGVSFYGFCLIEALFFYFCLWKGLKRYTNHFGIVILLFLYKLFFYNTMISMRQSLTIACFFLMLPLIENKEYIKYYIAAYFVSFIHNGALLLFVLYPWVYIALTKGRIVWLNIIFIPTFFIGALGIDVLGPLGKYLQDNAMNEAMADRTAQYFEGENLSPIGIFHTLEYFLMMTFVYLSIKKLNLANPKVHTIMWMFLYLLPLFTLFRGSEILTREKDYFLIYYAVILGYMVDVFPKYRQFIYAFVTLLCAFGYYRFVILFDDGHFLTYRSWLFDSQYSFFLR